MLSQHHICPRISQPVLSSETKLGPSLVAQVVLSFGAAMSAVPLSPRRRGGQTLRDTARFMPSSDTFPAPPTHPMRLGRCGTVCWRSQGCHRPSECAQGRLFDPESAEKWRGAAPLRTPLQRGDTPLRNPPVLHCFSGQCGRKSGHFFRELSLSVHGRDGLSRPFPRFS